MPFKIVKSEINRLTPEFLAWFRELPTSPWERDLKPSRVAYLQDKATADQLIPFIWAAAKVRTEPDKLYRVNGQNSSHVLANLASLSPDALIYYTEYEVEKRDELALLFRQYDPRQSVRSSQDVCNAYKGLVSELASASGPLVKLGTDGAFWYHQNVQGIQREIKGDDKYASVINVPTDHPFLLWVGSLLGDGAKELRKVPVVAVMYATFEHNEESAREFWADVVKGTGPENDPAVVLDEFLNSALRGQAEMKLLPGNYWNACVFAWNAYRTGRPILSIPGTARGYGTQKGMHEIL